MTYRCNAEKRATLTTLLLCLAIATVSLGQGYLLTGALKWILSAVAAVFFGISMYIFARYVFPRTLYVLEGDCIKVYKIRGKSSVLCADIPYYQCLALTKKSEYSAAKKSFGVKRSYDYTQNLYKGEVRMLICDSVGERCALRLEADSEFFTLLSGFLPVKEV